MNLTAERDQKLPPGLETLGKRLRAVTKARKVTDGEAAKSAKVSRTTFSQWKNDAVKHPDLAGLGAFAAAHDVTLDWLVSGTGPAPVLAAMVDGVPVPKRPRSKADPASNSGGSDLVQVPEISPSLAAHARGINRDPRAVWVLPRGVLELGFGCEPAGAVLQRMQTAFGPLAKDAFVIIDTTRETVDEPGIYLLTDAEAPAARRVSVDDTLLSPEPGQKVLGRIMGVFTTL